jgi:glucosamine--fructose-6-phosphate aminotransferase (isomerizing)
MCGIVGYIGNKRVVPILIEGLKRLEYRGYDSAGLAVVDQGRMVIHRSVGKIKELENALWGSNLGGTIGLGHTRWATHGRPTEENAHPHTDCTGDLVVIHNGIIENYLATSSGRRPTPRSSPTSSRSTSGRTGTSRWPPGAP